MSTHLPKCLIKVPFARKFQREPPVIPAKALDRLIELGRPAGSLRIGDLGRMLPVETMTVGEIAEVVARVEEAGISVVVDPALEAPHHRNRAPIYAVSGQPALSGAKSTDGSRLEALATSIKEKKSQTPTLQDHDMKQSRTPFIIAAAVILIALMLVAWGFSSS